MGPPPIAVRNGLATVLCVLLCGSAVLAVPVAQAAHRTSVSSLHALDSSVLGQLNQIRAAHHLVPLELSKGLAAAAHQHSTEMARDGDFDHNSPDGSAFWKRLERYYPHEPTGTWSVGENILFASAPLGSTEAVELDVERRAPAEHPEPGLAADRRLLGRRVVVAAGLRCGPVVVITTDFGVR